jgi:phage FluMu gp28-like protein
MIKPIDGILLPYQQRWISNRASFRVCEKGRRVGITWAQAADDVLKAATTGLAGSDVLYIGYNEDMTREYIDTCAEWAQHFNICAARLGEQMLKGEDAGILKSSISMASGYVVNALSSRPRNLRGKQGRIVIDEAAFHDDLKALIKAAMSMKIWGGETVVISSHNGEDNAFNELISDIRAGKIPGSVQKTTFDDAINDGLAERVCLMLRRPYSKEGQALWRAEIIAEHGIYADEELFCIPSGRIEGALWSQDVIAANRVRKAPELERLVVGVDPMGSAASKDAEAGIVAVGRCGAHLYVLSDATQGGRPHEWGSTAIAEYQRLCADALVAEINYGGDMVEHTIHSIDNTAKVKQVRATRGKIARAEPIAALYDRGLVHHVGTFPALEREMRTYNGTGKSPNRMDALVWACTELIEGTSAIDTLRKLTTGMNRRTVNG